MAIPERRKLFRTGQSLAVTIPNTWIKHHQLQAGDALHFFLDEDLRIVKSTKPLTEYKLDKDLTRQE